MRESRWRPSGARLLGVGLAAALSAVTVALWLTGRLGLYINPDGAWFAVSMAIVALVGCAVSFALPRGAEGDHGHDHGGHDDAGVHPSQTAASASDSRTLRRMSAAEQVDPSQMAASAADGHSLRRMSAAAAATEQVHPSQMAVSASDGHSLRRMSAAATAVGGILATGIVAAIVLTPPATLSAELAMQRDTGAPPLFQGADSIALAATGDTASFGVGEWASVFATATNPEVFDGDEVTLTGFVTPGDGGFALTRLVITHCVIDAQPASVAIATGDSAAQPSTGQWVTVTGTIRDDGGRLAVHATSIDTVAEPKDPYEY